MCLKGSELIFYIWNELELCGLRYVLCGKKEQTLSISSAFRGSGFKYAVRVGNSEHVLFIPDKDSFQPQRTTRMSSQPCCKAVCREARNQAGGQMEWVIQMGSPIWILQIYADLSPCHYPATAYRILNKCKKKESRQSYFRLSINGTRCNETTG